jgi:hypothetical protein
MARRRCDVILAMLRTGQPHQPAARTTTLRRRMTRRKLATSNRPTGLTKNMWTPLVFHTAPAQVTRAPQASP